VVPRVRRPVHPVQHPAPVGVEQPPEERPRVEVDQFLLPHGELDLPLVLTTGSMLREQARPVLGTGVGVPAAFVCLPGSVDFVRQYLSHRKLALPNQVWVSLRARNAKLVHPAWSGAEAPVTEIEAEQVGVRRLRQILWITVTDGTGSAARPETGAHPIEVWRLAASPLSNRASWDASVARDLAVVPTRLDERQDPCDFRS
jgi:hypothetical protein